MKKRKGSRAKRNRVRAKKIVSGTGLASKALDGKYKWMIVYMRDCLYSVLYIVKIRNDESESEWTKEVRVQRKPRKDSSRSSINGSRQCISQTLSFKSHTTVYIWAKNKSHAIIYIYMLTVCNVLCSLHHIYINVHTFDSLITHHRRTTNNCTKIRRIYSTSICRVQSHPLSERIIHLYCSRAYKMFTTYFAFSWRSSF